MEFTELIKQRRSTRANFTQDRIAHDEIVRILQEAQQAPSWKNWQASRCYVVESEELLQKFRRETLPDFNQRSSENAVLLVSTVVKGQVGFEEDGEPANEVGDMWGAYDLGLRDAYLVLAAKNAGYDTLIMGLRDSDKIRQLLQIPEEEMVVSVIAIGKSAVPGKDRKRKALEDVTRFA